MQDRERPDDFRAAERTDRLRGAVTVKVFPLTDRIGTLQQMVRRLDDGAFPGSPVRTLCRIRQPVYEGLFEKRRKGGTGDLFRREAVNKL